MEFYEVLEKRRSMRAFHSEPVDQKVIERVFQNALAAPSNCNTQPWYVHIVSGPQLEALRAVLPEKMMAGEIELDFPFDGVYEGEFKARQHASAKALSDASGIDRHDKANRNIAFMRNFMFFDAPHAAFFYLPAGFSEREACDLGMFAQSVMLGLVNEGLGSCPQTALSFHAGTVREALGITDGRKLMFGLSFGRPLEDAPVNQCRTARAEFSDLIQWHTDLS